MLKKKPRIIHGKKYTRTPKERLASVLQTSSRYTKGHKYLGRIIDGSFSSHSQPSQPTLKKSIMAIEKRLGQSLIWVKSKSTINVGGFRGIEYAGYVSVPKRVQEHEQYTSDTIPTEREL